MKDYYLFVKRFCSRPSTIGSILPSSRILAEQMTRQDLSQKRTSIRYLEVGAGSGALTKLLASKLREGDTLDLVELDPEFCERLRRQYAHLPHVTIHETSILDFNKSGYDVVVTSLPLNAFNASLVDQILLKYKSLVKPGGYISYFEYIGLGKIKEFYLTGKNQADFRTTLCLKKSFVETYCKEIDRIWLNFPPARVFHCQM